MISGGTWWPRGQGRPRADRGGVSRPVRGGALIPLAITLADVAGFALFIAGLALVVPAVGAIIHVIQNMIMLLNGALIPVSAYPPGLQIAAKLVPTTLGMDTTRRTCRPGCRC